MYYLSIYYISISISMSISIYLSISVSIYIYLYIYIYSAVQSIKKCIVLITVMDLINS